MNGRLLIVDGTALVMRPWFGGAELPWAVARMAVRRALPEVSHCCVVIDRTLDTFRREIDPSYKAHRPPAPPDLIEQFDRFEAEMARMDVPVFGDQTHEADDYAATLCRTATAASLEVDVWSADKDLFQLVRDAPPRVRVVAPARGWEIDEAEVMTRLGVRPDQVRDYLSLVGDSSDGIPGVKGVGAKTAAALLAHFDTMDSLYTDLGLVRLVRVRGAKTLGHKLEAGRAAALLARRLVTLVDDIPLPADALEQCKVS